MRKLVVMFVSLFLVTSAVSAEDNTTKSKSLALATFGGGCFWCMEPPFDKLDGVLNTVSGFSGGKLHNPSYKQVTRGGTGHTEVIQVTYDATKVSYEELLSVYWRNVDPLDKGGQFCDRGYTYRPVIFVHSQEQHDAVLASKESLKLKGKNLTAVEAFTNFYSAEDYHQDYYSKNPIRYKYYRNRCGRDKRLNELWGKRD